MVYDACLTCVSCGCAFRVNSSSGHKPSSAEMGGAWSGELSRKREYLMQNNEVTVNLEGDNSQPANDLRPQKERPVWMTDSTVEGAITEENTMVSPMCNREHFLVYILGQ